MHGMFFQVTGAPLDAAGRRMRQKQAIVTGADGNPACTPGEPTKAWKLVGQVAEDGKTVKIDFSPKGGEGYQLRYNHQPDIPLALL